MNKNAFLFLIGALLAMISSTAHAFDGHRKGFVIGLGLGAHTSELTYKNPFAPSQLDSEKQTAVALLLGYGFSNHIVGHIGGRAGSLMINDQDASLAIAGIGGSLYLSPSSPSLYVTGLVGSGSVGFNDDKDRDPDTGSGWLVGVGYEITHRLHLELSHARADLVDPLQDDNTYSLESSFLTMQYIWY